MYPLDQTFGQSLPAEILEITYLFPFFYLENLLFKQIC